MYNIVEILTCQSKPLAWNTNGYNDYSLKICCNEYMYTHVVYLQMLNGKWLMVWCGNNIIKCFL